MRKLMFVLALACATVSSAQADQIAAASRWLQTTEAVAKRLVATSEAALKKEALELCKKLGCRRPELLDRLDPATAVVCLRDIHGPKETDHNKPYGNEDALNCYSSLKRTEPDHVLQHYEQIF